MKGLFLAFKIIANNCKVNSFDKLPATNLENFF